MTKRKTRKLREEELGEWWNGAGEVCICWRDTREEKAKNTLRSFRLEIKKRKGNLANSKPAVLTLV